MEITKEQILKWGGIINSTDSIKERDAAYDKLSKFAVIMLNRQNEICKKYRRRPEVTWLFFSDESKLKFMGLNKNSVEFQFEDYTDLYEIKLDELNIEDYELRIREERINTVQFQLNRLMEEVRRTESFLAEISQ